MSPFSTIWRALFFGERADFGMSGERRFVSPLARTTAQLQVHIGIISLQAKGRRAADRLKNRPRSLAVNDPRPYSIAFRDR
jgi:hypothetical protein